MPDLKPRNQKTPLDLIPWRELSIALQTPPAVTLGAMFVNDGLPTGAEMARLASSVILLCDEGEIVEWVALAFKHGSIKYGLDNWRESAWEDLDRRTYYAAFLRHLVADGGFVRLGANGPTPRLAEDPESGVPHVGHALACALIYIYKQSEKECRP